MPKFLDDLVFPGTHDSGTSQVTFDWLPQPSNSLSKIQHYSCGLLDKKITKWTKTQSLSISDQLRLGCRYFDLDISVFGLNNFWTSHTFACHPLQDIFLEVMTFLVENPLEFVILDFSLAFDRQELNFNPIPALGELINQYLSSWMSPISPWNVPLENLRRRNHRLIVVTDSPDLQSRLPGVELSSRWSNTWIDTSDPDKKISGLRDQITAATSFYKLEWTLTPQIKDILISSSLQTLARDFNSGLSDFLASVDTKKIKIIVVDFLETSNVVEECQKLNF